MGSLGTGPESQSRMESSDREGPSHEIVMGAWQNRTPKSRQQVLEHIASHFECDVDVWLLCSCYMASVMQVLFSLDSFRERYFKSGQEHLSSCTSRQPWDCYLCQMSKLGCGLLSGDYSKRPQGIDDDAMQVDGDSKGVVKQPGISPRMFKTLITKDNPEFRSSRQQVRSLHNSCAPSISNAML